MSVYTSISATEAARLLADYPIPESHRFQLSPIQNGIENSNYLLQAGKDSYILTIYEHFNSRDIDWYLHLLDFLRQNTLSVPQALTDKNGQRLCYWQAKPAALFKRLPGQHIEQPELEHCRQIGEFLARLHLYTRNYPRTRTNPWDTQGLLSTARQLLAENTLSTEDKRLLTKELGELQPDVNLNLPQGIIHADLFRDNALFLENRLSGVLDFYSACSGPLLFDLATVVNDWCLEDCFEEKHTLNPDRVRALLQAYQKLRPLTNEEHRQWPAMLRFAVLRFWISRLLHQNRDEKNKNSPQNSGQLIQDKDPDVLKYLLLYHRDTQLMHQILEYYAF